MVNLLTPEAKETLKKDARLKILASSLFALSFILLIAIFLLGTIYAVLNIQKRSLVLEKEASALSGPVKDYEELIAALKESDEQAKKLAKESEREEFSKLISLIAKSKNSGIKIVSFRFLKGGEGNLKITLKGTSLSRVSLTTFISSLRENKNLKNVEAPLSSLVSEGKSEFTLDFNLISKNEKTEN